MAFMIHYLCNSKTRYDRQKMIAFLKSLLKLSIHYLTTETFYCISLLKLSITFHYWNFLLQFTTETFYHISLLKLFASFSPGQVIPRRQLPPQRLIEYYSDARNRGYLSNPQEVAEQRLILSQVNSACPIPLYNRVQQSLTQSCPDSFFFHLFLPTHR